MFGWVHVPMFDSHGWPVENRGVVDKAPGLFFCGLGFQYAASSMLSGVPDGTPAHVVTRFV